VKTFSKLNHPQKAKGDLYHVCRNRTIYERKLTTIIDIDFIEIVFTELTAEFGENNFIGFYGIFLGIGAVVLQTDFRGF